MIENAGARGIALSNLWPALAQAGKFEQAQEAIEQIEDAGSRGGALLALAETRRDVLLALIVTLSKAHRDERGLVIVQHAWLRATARDEVLSLLKIAQPFILLHPELGRAFFEALVWVDNFLKG